MRKLLLLGLAALTAACSQPDTQQRAQVYYTTATPTYVPVVRYVHVPVYYGGGGGYDADDLEDRIQALQDRIDDLEFEQLMRDD